jgi:hypothetical protein
MNSLISTLHEAGTNPYAWTIVGLIAVFVLFSVYKWRTCPYLRRTSEISLDESQRQLDRAFSAGPRFVIVMLAGIAAILAGLTLFSRQIDPLLALLLIAAGVFAVHLEPALLRIQEAALRVVSAQCQGPDAIAVAEERLRYAYIWLVVANVALFFAVIIVLLAF